MPNLTDRQLLAVKARTRLSDGRGLYFQSTEWTNKKGETSLSKSWEFRFTLNGKTRSMGLGRYPTVTLAQARGLADEYYRLVKHERKDPIEVRKEQDRQTAKEVHRITFAEAVEQYLAMKTLEFENPKHAAQWKSTLETYASNPKDVKGLGGMKVSDIGKDDILRVLEPIWHTKTETASRLRGRIENVLSWATVAGHREGENPAQWKGNLAQLLPKPTKLKKVSHHAALPYAELGAFILELRKREGFAARALEFSILTAARSGEVREAVWAEIDLNARVWIIPAERMKARKEHRVALCDEAIAILHTLPRIKGSDAVFPAPRGGKLSDGAMRQVLKRMERSDLTQHGFRSTFRDWAGETTAHPREVIEQALAHSLKDKAEAAYARGDLMAKRQRLMADWDKYCGIDRSKLQNADVLEMRKKGT